MRRAIVICVSLGLTAGCASSLPTAPDVAPAPGLAGEYRGTWRGADALTLSLGADGAGRVTVAGQTFTVSGAVAADRLALGGSSDGTQLRASLTSAGDTLGGTLTLTSAAGQQTGAVVARR